MKTRKPLLLLLVILCLTALASGQIRIRKGVQIPDIPGYRTLKCDLHIHTVFSDGSVWPDIRPEEAWREGLDAIAITDHIEYQPHKADLPTNHNRSFEIAKPRGDLLALTMIKGTEVTRSMPPGHLNAVFVTDVEPMDTPNWQDAVQEANKQGAFVFWNHPGWTGHQPDGISKWYPEHTQLVEANLLHGIEVVNGREYYPEAHRWCIENNLTLLSTSDIHTALNLDYHVHQGDHRPMTLVFATDNSVAAIKDALFNQRTALYSGNRLIGDESFLRPIFDASIQVENPSVHIVGNGRALVRITNTSEVTYRLSGNSQFEEIRVPGQVQLVGGATSLLEIRATSRTRSGRVDFVLPYRVENARLTPESVLAVELKVSVTFQPAPE